MATDHLVVLVLMQDNRIMFEGDGCDDEICCGQGQTRSSQRESERIDALPCEWGNGEYVETFQLHSQVVALGLGLTTLEEFQDHDGAGGGASRRDAVFEELFEFRMAGLPEADDPCRGINQNAFSRHDASS